MTSHSSAGVELMKQKDVYCCFGIHPHEAKHYTPELEASLVKIFEENRGSKALAWGEIGLDYHYDLSVCLLHIAIIPIPQ